MIVPLYFAADDLHSSEAFKPGHPVALIKEPVSGAVSVPLNKEHFTRFTS